MPDFGSKSQERLVTLHDKLQYTLQDAIKITDFAIVWGYRDEASQNEAYATGHSDRPWPNSLHNQMPSRAVDVAPWPIHWESLQDFIFLAGVITACAGARGIKIKWGGRWKHPQDWGHFELPQEEA